MLSRVYLKTRIFTITIISVLVGFTTGIMAFFLTAAIELGSKFFLSGLDSFVAPHSFGEVEVFHFHFHLGILPLFIIPALGGLLRGVVGYFLAPETLGGGSNQAVKAFHHLKERIATKVPFVKVIVTGLTIGSGGSGGREGPIMQIGAGMGSILGGRLRISEKDKKILIASGIGAGMSAVFMAPLGGAIFGIEVLYKRDYEVEAIIPAVISSIVSFAVFTSILDYFAGMPFGELRIFSTPPVVIRSPFELLTYLLLGVACGLLSLFYVFTYKAVRKFFKSLPFHTAIRPAIGGLIVGLIGWKFPYILGTGYGYAEKAIHGAYPIAALLFAIAIVKIISTTVTVGSGGSGGLFAPAVVIGCMFGGAIGYFLHGLFPNLIGSPVGYMLVGMAAMLAGAFKTPLAGIIMVLEMTGGYNLLPALAVASIVAYAITGDYTLCDAQFDTRAESPVHSREMSIDILKQIKVEEAMVPREKIIIVNPETTVMEILKLTEKYRHIGFPVMEGGELVGIVTFEDVERVPPELMEITKVRDVMSRHLIVTYPDETLSDALIKLATYGVGRLPVVRRDNQKILLGMINRPAIVRAYARYTMELAEGKREIA